MLNEHHGGNRRGSDVAGDTNQRLPVVNYYIARWRQRALPDANDGTGKVLEPGAESRIATFKIQGDIGIVALRAEILRWQAARPERCEFPPRKYLRFRWRHRRATVFIFRKHRFVLGAAAACRA